MSGMGAVVVGVGVVPGLHRAEPAHEHGATDAIVSQKPTLSQRIIAHYCQRLPARRLRQRERVKTGSIARRALEDNVQLHTYVKAQRQRSPLVGCAQLPQAHNRFDFRCSGTLLPLYKMYPGTSFASFLCSCLSFGNA
jgi:hypothetical protein